MSSEWMILKLDERLLEFFHHPELDTQNSWHSACIRVENIDDYFEYWAGQNGSLFPDAKMLEIEPLDDIQIFHIMDMNGRLIRCIQKMPEIK